jgi:hypothetical protein
MACLSFEDLESIASLVEGLVMPKPGLHEVGDDNGRNFVAEPGDAVGQAFVIASESRIDLG